MSLWTIKRPPYWFPTAVARKPGWVNPRTGEILVCISNLQVKREDALDSDVDNIEMESGDDLLQEESGETPFFILL